MKIFLNLSKEEQRIRLLRRLDLPDHRWKFSASDVTERDRWDDYQRAFSHMLSHTSTPWAPWYVVPADRKWFARTCASVILAHSLIELDPQYPAVSQEQERQLLQIKAALEAEAPAGAAPDPFRPGQDTDDGRAAGPTPPATPGGAPDRHPDLPRPVSGSGVTGVPPRLRTRAGTCCTAHRLPSGSAKNTNVPHGNSCTALTSTPPLDQLVPGRLDVGHDHLQSPHRPRRHVREAGPDGDRARRPGRRELHEAELVAHGVIGVGGEADLLGVERLGPVHVRDRNLHQLELPIH